MSDLPVGRINRLAIYPVKSLGGIEIPYARLTRTGLVYEEVHDHQYMIIKDKPMPETHLYNMMTQREFSQMARFTTRIDSGMIILVWDETEEYAIEEFRNSGLEFHAKLHDDVVYGVDQGEEIAKWLSDHIGKGVRLIKSEGSFKRLAQQTYIENDNTIRYQDGYPIHLFTQASLDELAERAKQEFSWKRFRPQIVLDQLPAQYEHQIVEGEINGVKFLNAKPCGRCPITKVDPETAKREKEQPLATLDTYMYWINPDGEGKTIFGQNTLVYGECDIRVGDPVNVLSIREQPFEFGDKKDLEKRK